MSATALRVLESPSPEIANPWLAKQDAVRRVLGDERLQAVVPASRLSVRPRPLMVSTGIAELDALAGGLPRGALTEVIGPASSGRSSVLLSVLAAATAREDVCALVDTDDAFDPQSAVAAGVDLRRVLWVRCGEAVSSFKFQVSRNSGLANGIAASAEKREMRNEKQARQKPNRCIRHGHSKLETRNLKLARIEQALKSADLLLQSGGFGVIAIDLVDVPPRLASRIPLTSWFRFRRAVENTPAVLLVLEQEPFAKSCASLVLKLENRSARANTRVMPGKWEAVSQSRSAHTSLLTGLNVSAEVMHDRTERKPVRSAAATFRAKAAWAG